MLRESQEGRAAPGRARLSALWSSFKPTSHTDVARLCCRSRNHRIGLHATAAASQRPAQRPSLIERAVAVARCSHEQRQPQKPNGGGLLGWDGQRHSDALRCLSQVIDRPEQRHRMGTPHLNYHCCRLINLLMLETIGIFQQFQIVLVDR